jgi:hypothetical protein
MAVTFGDGEPRKQPRNGVTSMIGKPRSDKGYPRKVEPEQLLEAIVQHKAAVLQLGEQGRRAAHHHQRGLDPSG